jgi:hypothetical protein
MDGRAFAVGGELAGDVIGEALFLEAFGGLGPKIPGA